MKIIEPSVQILNPPDCQQMRSHIELAARTCYKSEDRINEDSAEPLIKRLINSRHHSVLEHCNISVRFICDRGVSHELVRHRVGIAFSQESTRYCVAGQSFLSFANPHIRMTIADLYDNKCKSRNGAWRRMNIRQVDELTGEIVYGKIKNIHYMGKKPTLIARTKLGYTIQATSDHVVKGLDKYIPMQQLLGKKIATNGTEKLYTNRDWLFYHYNTLMKTSVAISEEFGFSKEVIKKWIIKHNLPKKPKSYFNKGKTPWNKGLTEDDDRVKKQALALRKYHWNDGHPSFKINRKDRIKTLTERTYHKTVDDSCAICGKTENLNVHHIDGNRQNNEPLNLITLCMSCHQGIHNKTGMVVYYDEVVSLIDGGIIDVYDIEMHSHNNNFVANGICVHNCNYSGEKFGKELTFIRPCFWDEDSSQMDRWKLGMQASEFAYFDLIKAGASPQEARSVLPNSLKTDIVVTANIREWRTIFEQRCASAAHPQMRQVMIPLLGKFIADYKVFFEDMFDVHIDGLTSFANKGWNLAEVK